MESRSADIVSPDAHASRGWRGVIVDERSAGRRVDAWLAARFSAFSRTLIARMIREGEVESEERKLKPSSTLHMGERLRIYVPGIAPDRPPPPLPPILHEDDRIIVFDKPAGLLMHPAGMRWAWALIGLAKQARPGHHLDLVHRLDRDTSGVVVLSKDAAANAFLKRAFRDYGVYKTYQALARGLIPWDQQELIAPLGRSPTSEVKLRQAVVPDGQRSRTTFKVLQRLAAHTLVACQLHTGRTHQIRVHLEHLGFPLLGDRLYGHPDAVFLHVLEHGLTPFVRQATGFPRQALHAWKLVIPHPDGHELRLTAPLPPDMAAIVAGQAPSWPDEDVVEDVIEDETDDG